MKKLTLITAFIALMALSSCGPNEAAQKTQCMSNLKSIGVGVMNSNDPSGLKGSCPSSNTAYTVEAGGAEAITAGTPEVKVLTCPEHGKSLRGDGAVK